jgi:hypothetical protein
MPGMISREFDPVTEPIGIQISRVLSENVDYRLVALLPASNATNQIVYIGLFVPTDDSIIVRNFQFPMPALPASAITSPSSVPAHKDTHVSGGSDAFASTDLLEALVKRVQVQGSGGPFDLDVGIVDDGQVLQRSGSSLIGVTIPTTRTWGNTLFVDPVYGNDGSALRERKDKSFLSLDAAIAAALSGDTILLLPGTYTPSSGITIPAGVTIKGLGGSQSVTIQRLGVGVATTLVTMGENSRLEDVTLKLTSSSHVTLTGIRFPGTTGATAKVRRCVVTVDNSTAGAGSSNVTGVLVQQTGTGGREVNAIRATTISVASTQGGTKRALLVDTSAGNFSVRDTNFVCSAVSLTGTAIAVEVNIASALLTILSAYIEGQTADVSRTAGSLELGAATLKNANTNGKSFTTITSSDSFFWGESGGFPPGTNFMRFGDGDASSTEIALRIFRPMVIQKLSARLGTAPGAGESITFTVRKNIADTALALTIAGTSTVGENSTDAVAFLPGDLLSMKAVRTTLAGPADAIVDVEAY